MNERLLFPFAVACVLAVSVPAFADTLMFRDGENQYAGTVDTELDADRPDEAKGTNSSIRLMQGPEAQGLLRFDGLIGTSAGQIPPGSTIESAKIVLTMVGSESFQPGLTISMHRVLVAWDETSTWNTTGSGIRQDDAESVSTPDAQFTTTGRGALARFGDFAPTVQAWADGAANLGWVLISGSTHPWRFATSEAPMVSVRPLLTVRFTPPPPTVDLAVGKSVDDPTPLEEAMVTFTIVVTNDAKEDATGVEVTDVLPGGLTFDAAVATAGSYDDGTGVWSVGTVAAAMAESLAVMATVDASTAGSTLVNTATITAADQPDDDPANDSASVKLVVQGAGFVERQLTSTSDQDSRPAVSPDGQTIAFDSNRSGTRDLYTIPFAGGGVTQLTTRPELDQHPDWSPDGTMVVFSAVDSSGANENLWVAPASGGAPTLLHSDPANQDRFPSWSPDGTQIAYTKGSDIYLIPAGGGTPAQLTTDPGTDTHPSWSPDGMEITFLSNRSGNNDIWTIPAAGGAAVQVTTDTSNDGAPDWSPDGTQIAFQSRRAGNNDIWLIPATGGTATQVTTDAGNDVQPDWAPNAVQIVFARGTGQSNLWLVTLPGNLAIPSDDIGTGVGEFDAGVFRLGAARPNPFDDRTAIPLRLTAPVVARLAIYDVGGRLVRTLLDESVAAGEYVPAWDGRDEAGRRAAPGVYFVRLDTEGATAATRKVVLRR